MKSIIKVKSSNDEIHYPLLTHICFNPSSKYSKFSLLKLGDSIDYVINYLQLKKESNQNV
ncbi:hypothetical protein BH10BAC2_BH10BAC2_37950 [soil metagenome]